MKRSPDDKKSIRLLRLIQLLCKSSPRRWRVEELAQELSTIDRNIYRDLKDVGEFIGVVEERPFYWVESGQAVLARLTLTEAELRSLSLSTRGVVDPILRHSLRRVLDKLAPNLDKSMVERVDQLARHIDSPGVPDSTSDRYEALSRAITRGQRLRLSYHSLSRPAPADRVVDPYTLFPARGVWYVSGFDHLSNSTRTFRVSRIASIEATGEGFRPDPQLGASDFLEGETEIELRVCALTARLLGETPLHPSQHIEGSRVTLRVGQPHLLVPHLLGLPEAEVLQPASLRDEVRRRARAVLLRHGAEAVQEGEQPGVAGAQTLPLAGVEEG